jgi:hypothetical protein
MHRLRKYRRVVYAVVALGSAPAWAAVGDTLSYSFNAASTGGAVPTISQAMLVLVETAIGVNFTLTPDWSASTGNRVDEVHFAYSGDALVYVDGAGPTPTLSFGNSAIDSGYNATNTISLKWPAAGNNPNYFNSADPFAKWSLNGATITLADFQLPASANSTKPAPAFGVIQMPGARPNNWVALQGVLAPVPEPGS